MTAEATVGTTAAIFGCAGRKLTAQEAVFFRDADPFGFILFARNVDSPDQLRRLTADLRHAVGRQAPIFVDQEGGRVQRLRAPHWAEFLPPLDAVNHARAKGGVPAAARMMWLRHRLIAADLTDAGIDANCAPCLDLTSPVTHPFLMNRCYGREAADVATLGRAAADGLLAGGVLPVMKHMPGHGRAAGDTHTDLPTVTEEPELLDDTDFAVFRALNDLPMAMTAHIVFAALDRRPATLSPVILRLIREQIGFGGLLMTDDLNMKALKGSAADKTRRAINAGCDLALFCKGPVSQMAGVADAAGAMGPATLARARRALGFRKPPGEIDIAALRAEHSGLLDGRAHV
jgi:beta-N-acetylhexosaminidase